MWGRGDGAWASVRKLWPVQERLFSEGLLGTFDGSQPDKPIYIAVRHFSVSFSFFALALALWVVELCMLGGRYRERAAPALRRVRG